MWQDCVSKTTQTQHRPSVHPDRPTIHSEKALSCKSPGEDMRPPGRGKMMETYKVEEGEEESCGGEPREASPRGTSVLPVALMLMCLCQST